MSKRATIVCASVGAALLFSAAQMTVSFDPSTSSRFLSPSLVQSVMGPEQPSTVSVDTSSAHYELLSAIYGRPQYTSTEPTALLPQIESSTLWLARAIYSETKKPHEQELVAWVIRNRVETGYRGNTTYEGVVLDPYQFSAFNPGSSKRQFYSSLSPDTQLPGWQQAISIAHYVRHADPAYRPFSIKTRHFFSERSMTGRQIPVWVDQRSPVSPGWNYTIDPRRFRFYEKIS